MYDPSAIELRNRDSLLRERTLGPKGRNHSRCFNELSRLRTPGPGSIKSDRAPRADDEFSLGPEPTPYDPARYKYFCCFCDWIRGFVPHEVSES